MRYTIFYTEEAFNDLKEIYCYIRDELQNPKAAINIYNQIHDQINALKTMPYRYQKFEDEPNLQELRTFPVNNYRIFYTINQKEQKVIIIRILHEKRNTFNELKINSEDSKTIDVFSFVDIKDLND